MQQLSFECFSGRVLTRWKLCRQPFIAISAKINYYRAIYLASGVHSISLCHVGAQSLQRFFRCCPCWSCFCLRRLIHRTTRNASRSGIRVIAAMVLCLAYGVGPDEVRKAEWRLKMCCLWTRLGVAEHADH